MDNQRRHWATELGELLARAEIRLFYGIFEMHKALES
jgi:hypothetical protein